MHLPLFMLLIPSTHTCVPQTLFFSRTVVGSLPVPAEFRHRFPEPWFVLTTWSTRSTPNRVLHYSREPYASLSFSKWNTPVRHASSFHLHSEPLHASPNSSQRTVRSLLRCPLLPPRPLFLFDLLGAVVVISCLAWLSGIRIDIIPRLTPRLSLFVFLDRDHQNQQRCEKWTCQRRAAFSLSYLHPA